jgi:cyclase
MKTSRVWRWFALLLLTAITCIGLLAWQVRSRAEQPTTLKTAGLTLEQVGKGIYALVSSVDFPPKDPNLAICNGGIVIGDDGVLVIDPFQNQALGNLMLAAVKTLTDQPVRYVLNTHFHFDHTGGNPAITAQNIPVIGRGKIRELMLEKNKSLDPNPTPPSLIVRDNGSIWLGKREIKLEEAEGHTIGTDIVAYVPDAKVLFTGDILFQQRFPYIADGNIRQWQNTLTELSDRYQDAKIVPGHGPIANSSGLATLKSYFDYLEALALSWQEKSLTEEQAIASAAAIPAMYQDYKFKALYPDNLKIAYQQITLGK